MKPAADRRFFMAAGIAAVCILSVFLVHASVSAKKELSSLKTEQKELLQLRKEYLSLRSEVSAVEGRKATTRSEGIVQAVDELFRSMGLDRKVKSVKSTGARDEKFSVVEEAEVQVEKVNMNEMTNIFYRIENGPALLSLKKTTAKTTFENPSLLNITMTIDLIKLK